jgi:dTMP kinase
MAGLLITFEGGEGVGKGTQVKLLKETLEAKGIETELTREPGGTPLGEKIRHMLKFDPDGRNMRAETEILLFVSARAENFFKRIAPALESGKVVLCDRFIDTATIYQGRVRGLGVDRVRWLNDFATGGRKPDITFLLDLPIDKWAERVNRRPPELQLVLPIAGQPQKPQPNITCRMDEFAINAAKEIREGYLWLAKDEPSRFVVIDASPPDPKLIAKEIWKHVENKLARTAKK